MITSTLRPDLIEPVNWTDLVLIQAFPYAVLVATIAVWGWAIASFAMRRRQNSDRASNQASRFLSKGEWDFGRLLEDALPDHQIHAKVAVEALLDGAMQKKRFSRGVIDFVVMHRATARVIALVELDNRPAARERDRDRDQLLADAGYRLTRFDGWAELPSYGAIEAGILGNFPGTRPVPEAVPGGCQIIRFPRRGARQHAQESLEA